MKDRNLQLFEKIGEIDTDYIVESTGNKKNRKKWRAIAGAACVGLCISSISYIYAERNHIHLFSQSYDEEHKRCEIQVDFEPVLESDLDGAISEVRKKSKDYYSQYYVDYDISAAAFHVTEFKEEYTFTDLDTVDQFIGHKILQLPINNKTSCDVQVNGNEMGKITKIELLTEFQFKEKTISALHVIATDQIGVPNVKVNMLSPSTMFLENQIMLNVYDNNQSTKNNLVGFTLICGDTNTLTESTYTNKQNLDTLILQSENSNKVTTIGLFHVKGCLYALGTEGELSEKEENITVMKELLDLYSGEI